MPLRVLVDTSPLQSGHAGRGIGAYTRHLVAGLQAVAKSEDIEVVTELGSEVVDLIHYPFFDFFAHTLQVDEVPVVVTIHDVIPLVFPQEYPPGLRGSFRLWQQRRTLHQVSGVITDSQCSRQDIQKHLGVAPQSITVTPLAANPDLQPVSEYLQRKYAEELGAPDDYILYIGDINYNKNLPTLLLALTQVSEQIHLCVVSRTFNNTEIPEGKLLAKIIQENGLKDRVHVLDVPGDNPELLSAVIGRARCLVQPSIYEGFGLPVLEAMQVGTPVVSSNAASLPEVAGDAAILVEPSVGGLSQGIEMGWRLRGEEREEMVRAGQKWSKQFTWQKTARLTIEAYRQSLQRREQERREQTKKQEVKEV